MDNPVSKHISDITVESVERSLVEAIKAHYTGIGDSVRPVTCSMTRAVDHGVCRYVR